MDAWYLLNSGPTDPVANMAWDEALLEQCGRLARPVLRLYGWSAPAATFGYFQHRAPLAAMLPVRPLLRRPTGGGLVLHLRDWTYSVAVPPGHGWYGVPAVESYRRMHAWLQRSFAALGVGSELAPCCRSEGPGQCFVGWEKFDLVQGDRKLAGAAQRRNRLGLLIQGSVQPPPRGIARSEWERVLASPTVAGGGTVFEPLSADADLRSRVEELVATRHGDRDYQQRR